MDITAATQPLARAATDLLRLLPTRLLDPVLSGMLLEAGPEGVSFAGTDRERGIRLTRSARAHVEGRALVPARLLADTLRSIDSDEVRLTLEGAKLAVRTPGARFALPLLDIDSHPGIREAPPRVGTMDASLLANAAVAASAASRDDALPLFTGVHVRQEGDRLVLVGTDRFRMAVVSVPWRPEVDQLDLLVPAGLINEVAKQASGEVVWRADADRVGLSYPGAEVTSAVLAATFPNESQHLTPSFDCTVEVDADGLAGAVRRVGHYAAAEGTVRLEVAEGEVRVRANDPGAGEAEEFVKATVCGDRCTPAYHPRYLSDAVQVFAGRTVRIGLRSGVRKSSVLSDANPGPSEARMHYVLMPKRG